MILVRSALQGCDLDVSAAAMTLLFRILLLLVLGPGMGTGGPYHCGHMEPISVSVSTPPRGLLNDVPQC